MSHRLFGSPSIVRLRYNIREFSAANSLKSNVAGLGRSHRQKGAIPANARTCERIVMSGTPHPGKPEKSDDNVAFGNLAQRLSHEERPLSALYSRKIFRYARCTVCKGSAPHTLTRVRNLLGDVDDNVSELGISDLGKSPRKPDAIGCGQKLKHAGGRLGFGQTLRTVGHWQALKEKRYRDLQDARQMLKPACTNAVGTLFVFLNLLECQSETIRKLFLGHTKHESPHADTTSHMLVYWVRTFLRHE